MASINQLQKRAKNKLKPSQVKKELFKYIRSVEHFFIQLNIQQIEDHEGTDGQLLENSKFNGVYSQLTEDISKAENPLAPKEAGQPYNFLWTGEFIKGFELYIKNGDLELFSTGTGSGDKAKFFDGYKHLFGLTDENLKKVIDAKLLPFLLIHFKNQLVI